MEDNNDDRLTRDVNRRISGLAPKLGDEESNSSERHCISTPRSHGLNFLCPSTIFIPSSRRWSHRAPSSSWYTTFVCAKQTRSDVSLCDTSVLSRRKALPSPAGRPRSPDTAKPCPSLLHHFFSKFQWPLLTRVTSIGQVLSTPSARFYVSTGDLSGNMGL